MFEKEAKEYSEKDLGGKYLSIVVAKDKLHAYKLGQYDGFLEGAEFAYNKANEWHYVKDGDLPKEFDKPYLCYLNGYFEVGYFMAYKEQPWHFDNYYLDNEDVDAWKEIVLPELPKESK